MRKRGSQSPYDRGEPDPLSNYFSPQELARYGLDDNGEPIPKPPRKEGVFWKEWTLDDIPDR
jgi:hypothetical protein